MLHSSRSRLFIVLIAGFLFSFTANAGVVKKSNSGLCHPPESGWYERTKAYQAYKSVEACLESGGELPKGLALASLKADKSESKAVQKYERSAFGHGWDDADGDCQDSRAEALIATSSTPVRFASDKRCRVVTGRWISPFTRKVIQNAPDIDIDHVVPLAWSWDRGAQHWSDDKRQRFANDMTNLWPVEAGFSKDQYRIGKALLL
ncbi:MAG: HNH endonuclease [Marinobacter sp.]|nr:MAG: HNH endonuclease [Marinobacter sp.]